MSADRRGEWLSTAGESWPEQRDNGPEMAGELWLCRESSGRVLLAPAAIHGFTQALPSMDSPKPRMEMGNQQARDRNMGPSLNISH